MSEPQRVLIVDDDRRMARTLVDILTVNGYQADAAYSAIEAMQKLGETCYDCVLSDIKMPESNGVELHRAIRLSHPDLPVVLMTAYATDGLVKEGLDEGAISVLTKPLDINLVLAFLSSLRKERSILIVDDDPSFRKTLGDILEARGYPVVEITDPLAIFEAFEAGDRVVVLLDMKLDGTSGLEVLQEIKEQHPHVPVILVSGYGEEMADAIQASLKLGAYTCLYKPLQVEELLQALSDLHDQELRRILGNPTERQN